MICSFDTDVLIWALRRSAPPGLEEIHRRAQLLFDQLDGQKATIVIPTVVVAEYLAGVRPQDAVKLVSQFQQRFFCPPFDLRASVLAAQLWQSVRKLPKDDQSSRRVLKADVLIVATAKVGGARAFYSHDAKCRSLAKLAGMDAFDLPQHDEKLFTEST